MTPAPLSRRFLAGLIDFAAVSVLSLATFLVPLFLRGFVLPMWGVLVVLVGYAVVPVAFLKQTVGLRILGLEVVRPDGHPVDLGNVLFRELLGRGLFPLAFLYTVAGGALATVFHLGAFAVPTGLGTVMFLASIMAVGLAGAGHLIALARPDGRTLADLMARSVVVIGPARPLPKDPDELAEHQDAHARRVRNIVLFELAALLSVVALPWFLTSRAPGETSAQRIHRIKREKLATQFAADPGNPSLTRELVRMELEDGLPEEARKVEERHRATLAKGEERKEAALREKLRGAPGDEALASELVQLLERQERIDDARAAYQAFVEAEPSPHRRIGFAHWLASVGLEAQAEPEARAALAAEPLLPFGHTILGVTLERLGRATDARDELFLALLDDPDDDDAHDALERVAAELGPLPKARETELTRRYERWAKDAGR